MNLIFLIVRLRQKVKYCWTTPLRYTVCAAEANCPYSHTRGTKWNGINTVVLWALCCIKYYTTSNWYELYNHSITMDIKLKLLFCINGNVFPTCGQVARVWNPGETPTAETVVTCDYGSPSWQILEYQLKWATTAFLHILSSLLLAYHSPIRRHAFCDDVIR